MATHLLVEVGRPREVVDGGIDAPPEILKHHVDGSGAVWTRVGKVRVRDGATEVVWGTSNPHMAAAGLAGPFRAWRAAQKPPISKLFSNLTSRVSHDRNSAQTPPQCPIQV